VKDLSEAALKRWI